jgi:hypothetical protein
MASRHARGVRLQYRLRGRLQPLEEAGNFLPQHRDLAMNAV